MSSGMVFEVAIPFMLKGKMDTVKEKKRRHGLIKNMAGEVEQFFLRQGSKR